jgi:tetratricopeptide (TPR) repeat protein
MTHIDEDALAEYVFADGRAGAAFAAIEGHLKDCEECDARYRGIAAFFDALTSRDMWEAADAGAGVSANERTILEFAARSQEEYAEARKALAPLIADTVGFVRERIERHEGFRTGGAVRVLSEAANEACERNPLHARNLADAAVVIAERLSTDDYPLDTVQTLRSLAWKERANALRFLAEYPAALDALDHAQRELSRLGPHAFEMGNIAYIRAVVFTYMDRLAEATTQAVESARIFAAYGDEERWMRARSVEAGVLFYRSEFAEAARAFEQLRAYAESKNDAIGIARHSYHMATCFLELGDATRAGPLLLDARRTYEGHNVRTEVVRTDWMLGVMARVAGRFEESITQLRASRTRCEELGMADESANVTLDLVESLLLTGQTREITKLCTDVTRHYRRAGKLRQALTAAAFLKEAAAAGNLNVRAVRHVRSFVQHLERQPDLLFAPPPSD